MIATRKPHVPETTASRPLALRRRLDVVFRPIILRGKQYWHLKDPVTLRYWQFGEEEFFLWQQLDGDLSLTDWQERFENRFAPRRIDVSQLQHFLGMLHREGLVYSNVAGQAVTMLQRRAKHEQIQLLGTITNLLAIRFRGVDPERWLSRVYPAIRPVFHPLTNVFSAMLILSAIVLVLVQWSSFTSRLPDAASFLTVQNLSWLAVALAMTKILHELGHAFTNKHFGGECHELGLLLLVFTPCLYCNVSDTWLIPEKWRRIAVSAAGIYVELMLAAVATWLWWLSAPGLFHSLCFSVMVVCSIGTLFVNGNPLLRYDGYFILSDLVELPNLKSEADSRLRRFLLLHLLGMKDPLPGTSAYRDAGLGMYAVASSAYRVLMVTFVMWFIYRWLALARLENFGIVVITLLTMAMAGPVLWRIINFVSAPGRPTIQPWRWTVLGVVAFSLASLLFVPWPRSITAPVTIAPHHASAVYVSMPGTLRDSVVAGTPVKRGQQLARLENAEFDFEIVRLTAERDRLRKHCDLLRQQQLPDVRAGLTNARAQLPIAEQSCLDVENQLTQRLVDREKLILRSPGNGIVVSPRAKIRASSELELAEWVGTPLEQVNDGCFLETGVLFCYITNPGDVEAVVMLDQTEVGHVRHGQQARVQIDELPGKSLRGNISEIAELTAEELPPELVAKGWFPNGNETPRTHSKKTYYQSKILLRERAQVPFGSSGRAKVAVDPQSLVGRTHEFLSHTFRFP